MQCVERGGPKQIYARHSAQEGDNRTPSDQPRLYARSRKGRSSCPTLPSSDRMTNLRRASGTCYSVVRDQAQPLGRRGTRAVDRLKISHLCPATRRVVEASRDTYAPLATMSIGASAFARRPREPSPSSTSVLIPVPWSKHPAHTCGYNPALSLSPDMDATDKFIQVASLPSPSPCGG